MAFIRRHTGTDSMAKHISFMINILVKLNFFRNSQKLKMNHCTFKIKTLEQEGITIQFTGVTRMDRALLQVQIWFVESLDRLETLESSIWTTSIWKLFPSPLILIVILQKGYEFFPDIPALQSETMVTDVNIINNLNGIVIRY